MDVPFVFHIGLPKTGTATLQKALFTKHPEVFYLGKDVKSSHPKGCATKEIFENLSPLVWKTSDRTNIEEKKDFFQEILSAKTGSFKVMLGSWEGLGNVPIEKHLLRMKLISSVFENCRIMLTLRNPLTQVPSEYLQDIGGNFVKRNRHWMGMKPYIDVDQWFEKRVARHDGLENVLTYSRNIETALELFGRENVGVFVFEELIANSEQYYSDICQFIGIDSDLGVTLASDKHNNKRTTKGQLDFLMKLNHQPLARLVATCKGRKYRKQLFETNSDDVPAKATLSPHWKKEISETTKSGNRWLAETFNLDLAKHGYPL